VLFFLFAYLCLGAYTEPKKPGTFIDDMLCELDPRINETTIVSYKNGTYINQIFKYLWPSTCGRSRGVFTLDGAEYRGNTYSCANWPSQWGINQITDWFSNPTLYKQHIHYLSLYIQGVYNTTAVKGPGTCDFLGFSYNYCGAAREAPWRTAPWVKQIGNQPLRGVNTGGVFVLEPWITPNFTNWSLTLGDQYVYSQMNPVGSAGFNALVNLWTNWYTNDDFAKMKSLGLNSIRLPVGWWYFGDAAGVDRKPYTVPTQTIKDLDHPITKMIKLAQANGLAVILDLHGAPGSQNGLDNSGLRSNDPNPEKWGWTWAYDEEAQAQTTKILVAMTNYINFLVQNQITNVIALELLNEPWVFMDMSVVRDFYYAAITAIRDVSDIPIVIHDAFRHSEWDWLLVGWDFKNIVMDTHIYHAFNSDDIASSTPNCDHNKMIVAENIACGYGSLLRYKTCMGYPTFLGEWSLAIDDCMGIIRGAESSVQTRDFGQCKNLKARLGDEWWTEQYRKFGRKQIAMAERELGWFFWTWKTGIGSENDPSTRYWSMSEAVKQNLFDNPLKYDTITSACYEFEDTEPYTC